MIRFVWPKTFRVLDDETIALLFRTSADPELDAERKIRGANGDDGIGTKNEPAHPPALRTSCLDFQPPTEAALLYPGMQRTPDSS